MKIEPVRGWVQKRGYECMSHPDNEMAWVTLWNQRGLGVRAIPVLVIPLDSESIEALREKVRKEAASSVFYGANWETVAIEILAAIGITEEEK